MRRKRGRWSVGLACIDESSSSESMFEYHTLLAEMERVRETHPKVESSSSSLHPCHSVTCTAQVCATRAALFKESLRRCPVVTLELAHGSAHLWFEWRIYLSREYLECSDVLPGGADARSE